MTTTIYKYPRTTVTESNYSFTRFIDIPMKIDCGKETPPGFNSELCGWNSTLCGNDKFYAQPVLKADKIHLQFQFINDWDSPTVQQSDGIWKDATRQTAGDKWITSVEVLDSDGSVLQDQIEDFADDWSSSRTEDKRDFQNVILNVQNIDVISGCFSLRITHQSNEIDPMTSEYKKEVFYSEPFEIIDCQNSMLLEGTYTSKDFQNNIYSEAPGGNWAGSNNIKHRAVHRFLGHFNKEEIKVDKTVNDNGFVTKIKTSDAFEYNLQSIPPYEVETLAVIVRGLEFYVNGDLHNDVTGFKKNNEVSNMWRPKFTSNINSDPNLNPANACD